jgi:hypothetical protein
MLTPNQVETIYRDEAYKAFLTELPTQAEELESQGFYDLFKERKINGYSYFETNVFGSYTDNTARNPAEPINLGTMGQGYAYATAIRSEFSERRTIADEYLQSTLKLGDYAATQGAIMAENYYQGYARYWSMLLALGGISATTLAGAGNGAPGRHPIQRIFNHALKGEAGAIIAEVPNVDYGDPDGKPWFTFNGNNHVRSNGDTIADYAGKTLGFFNAGSSASTGANMFLNESNLANAILHMENDLPWGPNRLFYSAAVPDTLIVSGNLRSVAAQILNLNEYRMDTPNNNKNVMYKQSGVFKVKNLIVNRFLPDNCWYLAAKGKGVNLVRQKGGSRSQGNAGPVEGSYVDVWFDMNTKAWVRDILCYWSHMFDSNMDICWYAGSTPTSLDSSYNPVAPTTASLTNW